MTATCPPSADSLPRVPGRLAGAVLLLALTVSVAACGTTGPAASRSATSSSAGESLPAAAALLRQAQARAASATTAHVSGSVADGDRIVVVDLAGRLDGTNQRLRVSEADDVATVLTVDGTPRLLGPELRWTRATGASAATLLGLGLPNLGRERAQALADLTVGGLVGAVFDDPTVAALATGVVSRATVDGRAAYALAEPGGAGSQLVVSADGSARLLRVTGLGGELRELTFAQWDAVDPFRAPAPSKVVDPPRS